jgi:peptide/nickel transport system substrate-binding protein
MPNHSRSSRSAVLAGVLTVLLGACAPQGEVAGPAPAAPERPAVKKVVTIGDTYEPKFIVESYTTGGPPLTANNMRFLVHDELLRTIQYQNYDLQLAAEMPSIERGTWKVNPDGSMETIWKLQPNVKWHDGAPFTSADLVFTFQTRKDKEIAGSGVNTYDRLIDGVSAPDPLTFVVHWNAPFVDAYSTGAGQIVPRHLLEETYLKDRSAFQSSPLLNTEFVGLGPFRLTHWERGVSLQVDRFDDYYRGRAPLDTIHVRFINDANTLVANVLSSTVDVAVSSSSQGISIDQAAEVQNRWTGTANRVVNLNGGNAIFGEPQLSPSYERPLGAQSNLQVRQALIHAIDRMTIAEVMTRGLSPVPDHYYAPGDPRLPQLEPYVVKYPYDPTRASQLFAQAGWAAGADGVLARQSDGQRFEIEFLGRAGPNEKVASIVTDYWKRLGIAATPVIETDSQRSDREFETKRPGYLCCIQVPISSFYNGNSHQRQIPTAATNWVGNNHGSYVNPRADAIVDELATTLDPRGRLTLEQQLLREYTADAWLTPMWWQILPQLVVGGVTGPNPANNNPVSNSFDWDRE